jgi:hypothetical protein
VQQQNEIDRARELPKLQHYVDLYSQRNWTFFSPTEMLSRMRLFQAVSVIDGLQFTTKAAAGASSDGACRFPRCHKASSGLVSSCGEIVS